MAPFEPSNDARTHRRAAALCTLAVVAASLGACRDDAVDPDGRAPSREARARAARSLAEVSIAAMIGAVAAVPARDAPVVLEGWLRDAGPPASGWLSAWPRDRLHRLDLSRAPLDARGVEGFVGPSGKTSCGEVRVVFGGAGHASIRLRLGVPATSPVCRAARRVHPLDVVEGVAALRDAIAAASVPELAEPIAKAF
jgi:hypothetical protein